MADTAETQPAPVNPADQRRVHEYTRILKHQAKERERAQRNREAEADYVNDFLRYKVATARASYETAQFQAEYDERKKKVELISKAKRNTAESFVLGGSSKGVGMFGSHTGTNSSRSRNLGRLARSCPDFETLAAGTSAKGHCADDEALEDQLFNGQCMTDMLHKEAFGVTATTIHCSSRLRVHASRPSSSPGVRRPKPSRDPKPNQLKMRVKTNGRGGLNSPELLRSMTEERLKDIERIERVLKGMKDSESVDGTPPLQQLAGIAKAGSHPNSRTLSDLSGDEPIIDATTPVSPEQSRKALTAAFNPLMKLKLKAMRIRKINVYMSGLMASVVAEEEAAEANSISGSGTKRSESGNFLLPSGSLWSIKLKRQKIRKINKYLSNLQNSFSGCSGDPDDEMTKEEMEELECILRDIPDPLDVGPPEMADSDGGQPSACTANDDDMVALPHVTIGYARGIGVDTCGYCSNGLSNYDDMNALNMKEGIRKLLLSDNMYTEFGLPADASLLSVNRNDNEFMMCTDATNRSGDIRRDIYKVGIPRCTIISEFDVVCCVNENKAPAHLPEIVAELRSIASLGFSLRISDVGLAYSNDMLGMRQVKPGISSPTNKGPKNAQNVLTSTGVLVELLGPPELGSMVGNTKHIPWEAIKSSYLISGLKKRHQSSPFKLSSNSGKADCSERSSKAELIPVSADHDNDRVVVSRHFLSVGQLHAISGCGFSPSLHKRLGKLRLFDNPTREGNSAYGYDATNFPTFGAPGMLFECLSTYMDAMGKGLLLEMILFCLEPSVTLIDSASHAPVGLGTVQYLNSTKEYAAGIAIRNDAVMKENGQWRVAVYLSYPI